MNGIGGQIPPPKNSDNDLIPSNCGSSERQTYMEYVQQQNNQSCEMALPRIWSDSNQLLPT